MGVRLNRRSRIAVETKFSMEREHLWYCTEAFPGTIVPNYRNAVKPRRRGSRAWIMRQGAAQAKRKRSRNKKKAEPKGFWEWLLS